MIDYTATYTDQYELSMAQAYLLNGKAQETAVFDYFFRKLPFNNGYAVFAGLQTLLDVLQDFHFDQNDLLFLSENGFDERFLDYLKTFHFSGDVHSCREGEIVFETEPVLQIEAPIIEAQIAETILLNLINFQTLIATKACRMRVAAGAEGTLVDFGLRRAQGPGGYYASRAAMIGGFDATSNVRAGRDFSMRISGTMAHSFVQSYDNEIDAFRDFAKTWPGNAVFLVDTYNTLRSGVPNAIIAGKEMEARGERLKGIRLDSGDLAAMAKRSRKMLDEAGLHYVKIAVSNKLDEYVIRSLREQNAPIGLYGVGTRLVIGSPDGALDGVYKLSFAGGKPRIKLTEDLSKITLPHRKQIYRLKDDSGSWIGGDCISVHDEPGSKKMHHPFEPLKRMRIEHYNKEPLLHMVMRKGKQINTPVSLKEAAAYSRSRLEKLPAEHKRFENPHLYKIGISDSLKKERDILIEQYRRSENEDTDSH